MVWVFSYSGLPLQPISNPTPYICYLYGSSNDADVASINGACEMPTAAIASIVRASGSSCLQNTRFPI
ncbi:hypothetical protein TNCV_3631001 [Trichonephila clavipes]|nr:hypothetical protein TNCV_3631001 [Trichonephila clavipes]